MRIFTSYDKMAEDVDGSEGAMKALDFVGEEDLKCGLRTIQANASPKVVANQGRLRRLIFVLKGSATITNGEYYEKITPGTFVLFEADEKPYYQTGDDELQVLEVAWAPDIEQETSENDKVVERRLAPKTVTQPTGSGVYMEI